MGGGGGVVFQFDKHEADAAELEAVWEQREGGLGGNNSGRQGLIVTKSCGGRAISSQGTPRGGGCRGEGADTPPAAPARLKSPVGTRRGSPAPRAPTRDAGRPER